MNTATLPALFPDPIGRFPGDPKRGWPSRLREALAASRATRLLLVAPGVVVDADTLALLDAALDDSPGFEAVSPVATNAVRRAWTLETDANAVLEAWTWSPHVADAAPPDPRCALWTRAAAERVASGGGIAELRCARLAHVAADLPAPADEPAGALDDGHADDVVHPGPRRDDRPRQPPPRFPRPTAAGRDGRPVILHVLHDWGGGTERFVRDQMAGDPDAHHLALVSHGSIADGHGQRLALYLDLDRLPIRSWRCDVPIGDITGTHPTAREALAVTLAAFGVSALRVSSLIGHSRDVLRTGLPTAFVVHDSFPFWPVLDDDKAEPSFDPARLAAAAGEPHWRFALREPSAWRREAEATAATLVEAGVQVVAPSRSALARLAHLLPEPLLRAARVIPHGVRMPTPARVPVRRPGPLRVLVPGRLAGGKGEHLLDALLPLAPAGIEWCFAGGAALARRYAASTGGEAIPDYAPDHLAAIVARFDPDLALLPSLLHETFGYVLSEMQALGVPVLAAARGAYGERVDAATHGLPAVAPDAAAFAAVLARLASDAVALPRALPPPPDLEASRRAWATAQRAAAVPPRLLGPTAHVRLRHANGTLDVLTTELARERDAAYLAYERDTQDLIRQRDVALEQSAERMRELERAQALVRRQQGELEAAARSVGGHVQRIEDLDAALGEARRRVVALQHEVEQATLDLGEAHAQRDSAYRYYERDTADLIRQRDVALSQRDAALDQLAQAQHTLANPLIRKPLSAWRMARNAVAAWRYRIHRGRDLAERALASLRRRGLAATWAAARRRWSPASPAAELPTAQHAAPLAFAAPATPRASLVIPVYGKLDFTMACLRSLASTGLPADAEVIVIDDASPDDTGSVLPRIPGLRYARNPRNLGFVGSCNAGAAMARGEFLVFLNNDTTLTTGWLDALLSTFATHPDTGLAGAQLVYPDGRLQEAGGIVFADGSGWNYGRFEDPKHPAYAFVREVDYCSGAAIALPRALFDRLGGFDARYAPAYYEDTDLAMKVREAGLKVRVQPGSVVVHHEGVTAGTDTRSGVKAYQVRNQARFVERWRDVLQRRHPATSQAPHYAAQHRARARVLVIDATTPMPDRDSGSVRLFELLRLFVEEGCAVTFFPENGLDDGPYTAALRSLGVEAWTQPWLGSIPDWLAKHGPRFQLIVVSRHYILSPLLPLLRRHAPQARIVFDTVDLHFLREQREAAERGDAAMLRASERTRSAELALVNAVERTWVVSPVEQALLAEIAPKATVDIVSNIHRVRGRGPAMRDRHGLLFVGGFRHPPNVDAARWLAGEILPRIRARRPEVTLSLVGSEAPPEVVALGEREGVIVHGYVPDLEPLIDAHRFSIAPLRYGAGVKGKVNQALAHGLPVVATRCAVEGMGLQHGVDALVADDADGLAEAVLAAYDDEPLWNRLVAGGLANTEREFSPDRARQTLRGIFAGLR